SHSALDGSGNRRPVRHRGLRPLRGARLRAGPTGAVSCRVPAAPVHLKSTVLQRSARLAACFARRAVGVYQTVWGFTVYSRLQVPCRGTRSDDPVVSTSMQRRLLLAFVPFILGAVPALADPFPPFPFGPDFGPQPGARTARQA